MYEQAKLSKAGGPRDIAEIDTSWISAPVEVCPREASEAAIPQSPLIPGTPLSGTADQLDPERTSIVSQGAVVQPSAPNPEIQKRLTRSQPGFL